MKFAQNRYWLFIVLFIALAACQPDGKQKQPPAEEKQSQASETPDKKDNADEKEATNAPQEYQEPEVLSYYEESNDFLKDKLLPIGWSKDGHFAYIREFADEACGCYSMEIVVQNMHTNKKVWQWETESMDYEQTLPDIWEANYQQFKKELNKRGIIQQTSFKKQNNTFTYQGEQYVISLETQTEEDPYFGIEMVLKGTVKLNDQAVHTFQEDPQYLNILGVVVYGHFISPYEDLTAILYKKERKGYEGPPHVITFEWAGAELKP